MSADAAMLAQWIEAACDGRVVAHPDRFELTTEDRGVLATVPRTADDVEDVLALGDAWTASVLDPQCVGEA